MNDSLSPILCNLMMTGDEFEICDLISRVFDEFNAVLYSEEGVKGFYSYVNPYMLLKRSKANHFVFAAKAANRIVGMIEIKDNEHISLFFVDSDTQNKGIGQLLIKCALLKCKDQKPDTAIITVNSSPYAVNIYKKLGFFVTGPETTQNGLYFTPMMLDLKTSALV